MNFPTIKVQNLALSSINLSWRESLHVLTNCIATLILLWIPMPGNCTVKRRDKMQFNYTRLGTRTKSNCLGWQTAFNKSSNKLFAVESSLQSHNNK